MSGNIESVLNETRKFQPPEAFRKQASISSWEQYQAMYKESVQNPDKFWAAVAEEMHWFRKWDRVRNWDNAPFAKWFEGGKTDPKLHLLRFDVRDAQIWLNDHSLFAGIKLLLGRDPKEDYKDKVAEVRLT